MKGKILDWGEFEDKEGFFDSPYVNKFQNPFRRPVATTVFLIGTAVALWLGIGATLPIDNL